MKNINPKELERVLDAYASGKTLRQVGEKFCRSMQAIQQLVKRHAPHLMRPPHVVPEHRRRKSLRNVRQGVTK